MWAGRENDPALPGKLGIKVPQIKPTWLSLGSAARMDPAELDGSVHTGENPHSQQPCR